jgi:hypothetical protein
MGVQMLKTLRPDQKRLKNFETLLKQITPSVFHRETFLALYGVCGRGQEHKSAPGLASALPSNM